MGDAFEQLVKAKAEGLARLAYLLTGNAQDAEDLVQTTFLRAYTHRRRIVEMDAPTAYLRTILLNAHLSDRRAAACRVQTQTLGDTEPAAPDRTEGLAADDAVWRLLATLPKQQRATLVLRVYLGMKAKEIADVLGVGEPTVRSNAARGLESLRRQLADQEEEAPR
ncbi:MAG: sigma-70 family RNA polymerase sigma factor [Nostocoides sp.]